MNTPLVAVIMGSKSEWETMRHADEMLTRFGVPHESSIATGVPVGAGSRADEPPGHTHPPGTPPHEHPRPPVRITMDELHRHGGPAAPRAAATQFCLLNR